MADGAVATDGRDGPAPHERGGDPRILAPVAGDSPCGEDPRFEDAFEQIEGELAKLSSAENVTPDWAQVQRLAYEILTTSAKDLRCLVWWSVARLRNDGLDGLGEALATMGPFLEAYAESMFPTRPRARTGALEWLGSQLDDCLSKTKRECTREVVDGLTKLVEPIGAAAERVELDPVLARVLVDNLDKHLVVVASDAERLEQARSRFPEGYSDLGMAMLDTVTRAESPTVLTLRVVRWALWLERPAEVGSDQRDVQIPVDQISTLENLLAAKDYTGLLEACERAFIDHPFWLDLSYWSARAAAHVFGEAGRLAIVGELSALLLRDPTLLMARDAEGHPLASADTRAWVASETGAGAGGSGSADDSVSLPRDIGLMLESGAVEQALIAAQSWLNVATGRVRFGRCVALANEFTRVGAVEQAFMVFRGLHNHLRSMSLKEWDPDLFAACLAGYLSSKKAGVGIGPEDEMLLEELSVLDPTAVMTIMSR